MLKIVLLVALAGYCAAQNLASLMALSSLGGGGGLGGSGLGGSGLGGSGGASTSTSSGGSGGEGLGGLLNNPMVLCRRTENFRPIPCRRINGICNLMSVTQYGFPGLLECSPMGIGCCIKDFTSLMMVNMLN